MSSHPYAWCVAVVGDPAGVMTDEDLAGVLDHLSNRWVGERRVTHLGTRHAPEAASNWAASRGYGRLLLAADNDVRLACEIVAAAHCLVVVGDPAPWSKLVALARDARVDVKAYASRPRLPPPAREWEIDWLPAPEFDH